MKSDGFVISPIIRHASEFLPVFYRLLHKSSVLFVAALTLIACAEQIPKDALSLSPESLERRQMQTRVFDTSDEHAILSASGAVLQDLGFNLDESETDLGVLVVSKQRDARETNQIIGAVVLAVLFGADVPIDQVQKIRVSLVTRPYGETSERVAVRVTFQRFVWNNEGRISRVEAIDDPQIYQEFYDKLAKSVFLEAHTI